MTLEEAIDNFEREIVEFEGLKAIRAVTHEDYVKIERNRQLAEWLKDYKRLLKRGEWIHHGKYWEECSECHCDMDRVYRYCPNCGSLMAENVGDLPSVKPQEPKTEPKYCDRNICIKNEYNGIGCGECEVTKSQEPCEDAISRQAVLDLCERFDGCVPYSVLSSYDMLPSVIVEPKTTGHWIERESGTEDKENGFETVIVCSHCDFPATTFYSEDCESRTQIRTHFCPNCGAKMERFGIRARTLE